MVSNWAKYKLGDVADIITGFPFKGEMYSDDGTRVVRGENVTIGELRWDSIKCWKQEFVQAEKYSLKEGDIVIGMDGSRVGKNRAQISKDDLPLLLAQRVARVRAKEQINQDFLFYVIKSSRFEKYISAVQTGTSIPHISQSQIQDFDIYIPDLETQNEIASILRTFDDAIKNNSELNNIIDNIEAAIFEEWFIRFNFPNNTGNMIESDFGKIPTGWRIGKIKELASRIQYGYSQSATWERRGPKYLRITDIQDGRVNWSNVPYCLINEKDNEKYKIEDYDIFVARTGASTGENTMIVNAPDSVFASYLIRIQFEHPYQAVYAARHLRSKTYFDFINSVKSGSAQPNANAQQLSDFIIVIPPDNLLEAYFDIVSSMEALKSENQFLSNGLEEIRENILPKLINSEIEFNCGG